MKCWSYVDAVTTAPCYSFFFLVSRFAQVLLLLYQRCSFFRAFHYSFLQLRQLNECVNIYFKILYLCFLSYTFAYVDHPMIFIGCGKRLFLAAVSQESFHAYKSFYYVHKTLSFIYGFYALRGGRGRGRVGTAIDETMAFTSLAEVQEIGVTFCNP